MTRFSLAGSLALLTATGLVVGCGGGCPEGSIEFQARCYNQATLDQMSHEGNQGGAGAAGVGTAGARAGAAGRSGQPGSGGAATGIAAGTGGAGSAGPSPSLAAISGSGSLAAIGGNGASGTNAGLAATTGASGTSAPAAIGGNAATTGASGNTAPALPSANAGTGAPSGAAGEPAPPPQPPPPACADGETRVCTAGLGICADGSETCSSGAWSPCQSLKEKQPEQCIDETTDEDCNGDPNNGCACVDGESGDCPTGMPGVCAGGTHVCRAGAWSNCTPKTPKTNEVCDGRDIDEDCDGNPNTGCQCSNGESGECDTVEPGVCGPGTHVCSQGKWSNCRPNQERGREVCDDRDIDEDCDGNPRTGCECNIGERDGCIDSGDCVPGTHLCDGSGHWGDCSSQACESSEICEDETCVERPLPEGSYQRSCDPCEYDGTTLSCTCQADGPYQTSIQPEMCNDDIQNCLGTLMCNIPPGQTPGGSYSITCTNCRPEFCGLRFVCEYCDPLTTETWIPLPCSSAWNENGELRCSD